MLTLERAKELNGTMVTDHALIIHATNVMAAMGAMAEHFGLQPETWRKTMKRLSNYLMQFYPRAGT